MTQLWQRRTVAALAFIGLAAFTETASAQCTPAATTNGPDVIVGDLTGPANYTASGGIEALAIGTVSCNIGNVWLNWISSTNQHPVIGQNMYRLMNGRFEQIGQSWLKHGFASTNSPGCGTCIQPPLGGAQLGVDCSDAYGACLTLARERRRN